MNLRDDPGIGNERTVLAWQRTALALVAGSAILTRLTVDILGWFALLSVGVAAPLGLWLMWEGRGRYLRDAGQSRRLQGRGGRAPLAVAIATIAIGATELVALLAR